MVCMSLIACPVIKVSHRLFLSQDVLLFAVLSWLFAFNEFKWNFLNILLNNLLLLLMKCQSLVHIVLSPRPNAHSENIFLCPSSVVCICACVCLCISVLACRVILMRDGLVWADTFLPPLEPIRIIIKITQRSLWPWLPSISIRDPSLSSIGCSETSFSITCLALCLGEQVATATLPSNDISTGYLLLSLFVCLFLFLCLCLKSTSSSFACRNKSLTVQSKSQTPINREVYICLDPGIH